MVAEPGRPWATGLLLLILAGTFLKQSEAFMEERVQQLESTLQQAIGALQRSEARVAALEGAAAARQPPQQQPPPPPQLGVPLVDMRAFGKPAQFSGDRESWRSWSFTMRAFAAALSPELRRLMDSAVATPNAIANSALQPDEGADNSTT